MTDDENYVRKIWPDSFCGKGTLSLKYWVMNKPGGELIGSGLTADAAWAEAANRLAINTSEISLTLFCCSG